MSLHIGCHLPIVQIKNYNATTNGRKFFDQLLKMIRTYEKFRKTTTGQGDDYKWFFTRLSLFKKI